MLGKLLQEVQPELMDTLIQATKDGDKSRVSRLNYETWNLYRRGVIDHVITSWIFERKENISGKLPWWSLAETSKLDNYTWLWELSLILSSVKSLTTHLHLCCCSERSCHVSGFSKCAKNYAFCFALHLNTTSIQITFSLILFYFILFISNPIPLSTYSFA